MMSNQPLSAIIRVADADEKATNKQRLVAVDDRGRIVKGMRGLLAPKTRYLVEPDKEIELRGQARIRDFINDRDVDVPYRCEISIPAGEVEAAVEGLWHQNKALIDVLGAIVQQAVKEWWEDISARRQIMIETAIQQEGRAVAASLTAKLRTKGLKSRFILVVDELEPKSKGVDVGTFPVRVKDFSDTELTLSLELELLPADNPGPLAQRQLATEEEWRNEIKAWARHIIKQHLSLHDYYEDRNAVETLLRTELDKELRRFARQCGWIKCITSKPDYDGTRFRDISVKWHALSGRELDFVFRVDAQIIDGQEQVYARAGKPDIGKWLADTLDTVTREALFGKEFTYLTPATYGAFQSKVAAGAAQLAKTIGIDMRMLVLKSRPAEWSYLDPFIAEAGSQDYKTADAGFDVEFDITLTARFPDLAHVKDLLWPEDMVKQEIAAYARRAAAEIMIDTQPWDYLARFQPTGAPKEEVPLAGWTVGRLKQRIEERVSARFQPVEISDIVIRRIDSRLRKVVELFESAQDKSLTIEVQPKQRRNSLDNMRAELRLRISSVRPADLIMLYKKHVSPEEVWETVTSWCSAELNKITLKDYSEIELDHPGFPDDPTNRQYEGGARTRLRKALMTQAQLHYGISIDIVHMYLHESLMEDLDREVDEIDALERHAALERRRQQIAYVSTEGKEDMRHRARMAAIGRETAEGYSEALGQKKNANIEDAFGPDFEERQKLLAAAGNSADARPHSTEVSQIEGGKKKPDAPTPATPAPDASAPDESENGPAY